MDKYFKIARIISKSLVEDLTSKERVLLDDWLNNSPGNKKLYEEFNNEDLRESALNQILRFNDNRKKKQMSWQKDKTLVLRHSFVKIAAVAAIFLLAILSGIYLYEYQNVSPSTISSNEISVSPGKSGAVLTLSTGKKLVLDELLTDSIQLSDNISNTVVISNKQLTYGQSILPSGLASGEDKTDVIYNTLEVPGRAEYQVILSDGTKVTLNANSSLKYPVCFEKHQRRVELSGEAFFEVAHNASQPFIVVDIYGNQIEVKGTSFNVKAYPDETTANVALVEGSVVFHTKTNAEIDLAPGYGVSFYSTDSTFSRRPVDIEEITSWKTGRFIFDNKDLDYIFSNISRWYGIKLILGDEVVKQLHFSINIPKYENLSVLTDIIESTESVRFEQNGDKLIVYSVKQQ